MVRRAHDDESFDTLREFLRGERIRLGMAQTELAKRAGITRQTVTNFELHRGRPRADVVAAIAKVLGVVVPPVPRVSPLARAWQEGHDVACAKASCCHSNPYTQAS